MKTLCVKSWEFPRTTLREAYGKLELLNLVNRSRGGTKVNDPADMGNLNPFDIAIKESELSELLEFRSMLESEIVALAAVRAENGDIEKLKKILNNMRENKDDLTKLTHYDTMFHFAIAEISKNSLLKKTMEMVRGSYEKVVYKKFVEEPEIIEHAIKYHMLILDAIAQKAPILARETMKEHIADVVRAGVKLD